jgi:hypothetical protein
MVIDIESSHMKGAQIQELGKCLMQASIAPRYTFNMINIEEHKKYMRDHALIGKFLTLWFYEKYLMKWIQHWWKPKGHCDLQIGSKVFFTVIFNNTED